ncbi:MAG: hypothetical protein J3Q66DRAFT_340611 [Benniella sp.]|nr:MAG: hypothetical protein J3Q66DRAFT_340611 [Benniella sp.]
MVKNRIRLLTLLVQSHDCRAQLLFPHPVRTLSKPCARYSTEHIPVRPIAGPIMGGYWSMSVPSVRALLRQKSLGWG